MRIVDPVLDDATPVYGYEPGTSGPAETALVAPDGGWLTTTIDNLPHLAQPAGSHAPHRSGEPALL